MIAKRPTLTVLAVIASQILTSLYYTVTTSVSCRFDPNVDTGTAAMVDSERGSTPAEAQSKKNQKVNILYGLSGGLSGFIKEFDVSLKSVLLNAPLDADLDIHLIVDVEAHQAVVKAFKESKIGGSIWRNQIRILFYPVSEAMKERYVNHVLETLPVKNITTGQRVGPGGLFRLFSYEILPSGTDSVVYLDNDVLVFANLNEINTIRDDNYMYQVGIGKDVCSGFMIINLNRFHEFWRYLAQVPPKMIPTNTGKIGDQLMLNRVKMLLNAGAKAKDRVIGELPPEWHVHLAHGFRKYPHLLRKKRPRIAIMHFNGKRGNEDVWWKGGVMRYCNEGSCKTDKKKQEAFKQTWNLAEYYINEPWSMARYLGESYASGSGKPLRILTRCPANEKGCKLPADSKSDGLWQRIGFV